MKNITLSAPEPLIEAARQRAQEEHTTLNAEFRTWLASYGQRKQLGAPHSSQKEAAFYAKYMFSGADRWTDAAQRVEPDPVKYPGDGEPTRHGTQ